MGASYGMVQQGIFRAPYGLQRGLYSPSGNEDPLAALIGNALGTYTSQTEKAKADKLALQHEQDETNDRNTRLRIEAYAHGLRPDTQTDPALTPQIGAQLGQGTLAGGARDTGQELQPPPTMPAPRPSPVATIGGTPFVPGQATPEYGFMDVNGHVVRTDKRSGTASDAGLDFAKPGEPHYFTDDQGRVTATTAGAPGHPVLGVQGPTKAEPGAHATPIQSQHAEFGAGALAAWQQVDRLRTQSPTVEREVGGIVSSPAFVQAIPGVRSSSDMVQLLKRAGASPAAQNYMRAKWAFLDNIIRTRIPGGRMSGALFTQVQNEFMPSLDPDANSQIRQNEVQAMLTAQGESGYDLNPDTWNKAVKRHGVGNLDLQAILAGGGGDSRMTHIQQRYR